MGGHVGPGVEVETPKWKPITPEPPPSLYTSQSPRQRREAAARMGAFMTGVFLFNEEPEDSCLLSLTLLYTSSCCFSRARRGTTQEPTSRRQRSLVMVLASAGTSLTSSPLPLRAHRVPLPRKPPTPTSLSQTLSHLPLPHSAQMPLPCHPRLEGTPPTVLSVLS